MYIFDNNHKNLRLNEVGNMYRFLYSMIFDNRGREARPSIGLLSAKRIVKSNQVDEGIIIALCHLKALIIQRNETGNFVLHYRTCAVPRRRNPRKSKRCTSAVRHHVEFTLHKAATMVREHNQTVIECCGAIADRYLVCHGDDDDDDDDDAWRFQC